MSELRIPVPWGHIAAQIFGNEKDAPVLMFHGMGDNAAVFERLISHLPNTFYYICVDTPGQGKSSHFPPYLPYRSLHVIFAYKLIVDYFKRGAYIIIGHSWGGRVAALFTQMYPQSVTKLILLDAIYLNITSIDHLKHHLVDQIDQLIQINEMSPNKIRRTFSYNDGVQTVMKSRITGKKLPKEAAEALFKRTSIKVKNDSFCFFRDDRVKTLGLNMLHGQEFASTLIEIFPIMCPVLIIIASESIATIKANHQFIIDGIKKRNKQCFVKIVNGDHDVHIKHPEAVASLIIKFLVSPCRL